VRKVRDYPDRAGVRSPSASRTVADGPPDPRSRSDDGLPVRLEARITSIFFED